MSEQKRVHMDSRSCKRVIYGSARSWRVVRRVLQVFHVFFFLVFLCAGGGWCVRGGEVDGGMSLHPRGRAPTPSPGRERPRAADLGGERRMIPPKTARPTAPPAHVNVPKMSYTTPRLRAAQEFHPNDQNKLCNLDSLRIPFLYHHHHPPSHLCTPSCHQSRMSVEPRSTTSSNSSS